MNIFIMIFESGFIQMFDTKICYIYDCLEDWSLKLNFAFCRCVQLCKEGGVDSVADITPQYKTNKYSL